MERKTDNITIVLFYVIEIALLALVISFTMLFVQSLGRSFVCRYELQNIGDKIKTT